MSDHDKFKDAFKAKFGEVAGIAKNLVSTAGDKAKTLSRIAKLTMDISAEKESTKKIYEEIGKLYYETNRENPGDFFVQLFDEVTLAREKIENMETELADLKDGDCDDSSGSFEEVVEADEFGTDDGGAGVEVEITVESDEPIQVEVVDETDEAKN